MTPGLTVAAYRAADLWNEGKTQTEIAKAEGVTHQAIRNRLVRAEREGLLVRPLPGKAYRENIARFNPTNRPGRGVMLCHIAA